MSVRRHKLVTWNFHWKWEAIAMSLKNRTLYTKQVNDPSEHLPTQTQLVYYSPETQKRLSFAGPTDAMLTLKMSTRRLLVRACMCLDSRLVWLSAVVPLVKAECSGLTANWKQPLPPPSGKHISEIKIIVVSQINKQLWSLLYLCPSELNGQKPQWSQCLVWYATSKSSSFFCQMNKN